MRTNKVISYLNFKKSAEFSENSYDSNEMSVYYFCIETLMNELLLSYTEHYQVFSRY